TNARGDAGKGVTMRMTAPILDSRGEFAVLSTCCGRDTPSSIFVSTHAGVVYGPMVRWALLGALAIVVLGAVETFVARVLVTRVARVSSLIAVIVQWLAAYVLF